MSQKSVDFPEIVPTRKTGDERFHRAGQPLDLSLLGFWQWSASDLVSNATRGILAEYIVANALGIAEGVRAEWNAFDLEMQSGIKIEVKSAAYLQSWYHETLSAIRFDIRPTRAWDATTNDLATEPRRQAEIYIFCVLSQKDQESLDPLDLDQWDFYVLPTSVLDEKCSTQKTIGLSSLLKLNPCKATYDEIASCIREKSNARKGLGPAWSRSKSPPGSSPR